MHDDEAKTEFVRLNRSIRQKLAGLVNRWQGSGNATDGEVTKLLLSLYFIHDSLDSQLKQHVL